MKHERLFYTCFNTQQQANWRVGESYPGCAPRFAAVCCPTALIRDLVQSSWLAVRATAGPAVVHGEEKQHRNQPPPAGSANGEGGFRVPRGRLMLRKHALHFRDEALQVVLDLVGGDGGQGALIIKLERMAGLQTSRERRPCWQTGMGGAGERCRPAAARLSEEQRTCSCVGCSSLGTGMGLPTTMYSGTRCGQGGRGVWCLVSVCMVEGGGRWADRFNKRCQEAGPSSPRHRPSPHYNPTLQAARPPTLAEQAATPHNTHQQCNCDA
jgi:hypothetical protein